MPKTVADVLALAAQVKMVDFRFTDLPGVWQHFTIPAHDLDEDTFEEGIGVRRLVDPRLQRDPRVGHAADARPVHRVH